MKKQASTRFLMWLMICLHVYLIIAAVSMSESNHSSSVCNGSVEECLSDHYLDSQLPTVSSSQLRRMLAGNNGQKTAGTNDPNSPFYMCKPGEKYISCLAKDDGVNGHCGVYSREVRCSG